MRAYTVAAAAVAIGANAKWVDNVLSHHAVPGVGRAARGVDRRLTPTAVLLLAITRLLVQELELPIARALVLAHEVARHRAPSGDHSLSPTLSLRVDVAAVERELSHRLAHAVETSVRPRRGRPPLTRRYDEVV